MLVRIHSLIVEPIRRGTVERIRARSGGKDRLQSCRAAVLHRKRIHLDAGFLNRFWLGRQVQHTLPDSTGHIEPVYHVLIVVLTLAVGAGIDLLFGGVIVYSGCWTARGAGSQA